MVATRRKNNDDDDDAVMSEENQEEQEEEEVQNQIRVTLTLARGIPDRTLELPTSGDPIAIPSNLRRKGLSAVVNHLLGRQVDTTDETKENKEDDDDDSEMEDEEDKLLPPSIPFDFVINHKLLRMSVEGLARRDGLSMEKPIDIQYFPAQRAPSSSGTSHEFPDWISCLSSVFVIDGGPRTERIVAGCYDGSIRLLSPDTCAEMHSTSAHEGAIKCLSSSSSSSSVGGNGDDGVLIATGSMDHTLSTHQLLGTTNQFRLHAKYLGGHSNSIESVSMLQRGPANGGKTGVLASGDWDGGFCLWTVPGIDEGNSGTTTVSKRSKRTKRSKKDDANEEDEVDATAESSPVEVQPLASWKAHVSSISGIDWTYDGDGASSSTNNKLITSSWDHSCKVWDVERQDCLLSLNGSRVVSAMGRCSNSDIVATGHPDCTIRLWDMRVGGKGGNGTTSNVSETSLRPSHKSWISSLQWSPTEPHVLATSSHDGTVKMWDVRSSLPLHTVRVQAKGEKGLCVAFGGGSGNGDGGTTGAGPGERCLFGGGSDCVVKKFSLGAGSSST